MTCARCGGLCHVEQILGRRGRPCLRLLVCFACGNRLDETIALNQAVARDQAHEARTVQSWKDLVWADVCALARGKALA